MKRLLTIVLALMLAGLSASAQFTSAGDDPGRVRWRSIRSDNFRIIYPVGSDSLALRYGAALERFRLPLASSIGYTPNGLYRRPLPVILHGYTATSNGSVTWAPRRMDLFTSPDATSPEPMEWITELAVHESRHVAQMQFARDHGYGLFNVLVGEIFSGAMAGLYPGPALLEGDAVVAETALTGMGRGRSADFLEYYRVSFADGDMRNWYRWCWGSLKRYTPDHYRAGYMLIAGTRYLYDDPLFMKRYYDNIVDPWLPLPLLVLPKAVKQASGMKLRKTWQEIAAAQQALWAADEAARGPFGPARQLTPSSRRYTEYLSPESAGDDTFAILHGITKPAQLVMLRPDGTAKSIRPLSAGTEQIRYSASTGRLYWSEEVANPRWSLKSNSRIFYLEPGSRKARELTAEDNLSNPSPQPGGPAVAVTQYKVHGGSAVRIIDGRDGATLDSYPAPDSLQVVETAWSSGRLVASAVSPAGFGLYDVTEGFRTLLPPSPVKIKQLRSSGDGVLFVSDEGGVNELYRLDADGARRLTNHRFGASDFLPQGDSLTFAALTPGGRFLYREKTPAQGVIQSETKDPYPVAERLSLQEAALGNVIPDEAKDLFSAPAPYRKLPHLLRLHSWTPLYIDYDAVSSVSLETVTSTAGLGATAFFQNDLGTASSIIGYSAFPVSTEGGIEWTHSVHGQFTYSGLYPVFELSTDIGSRNARRYSSHTLVLRASRNMSIEGNDSDLPYFRAKAKVYVPLNFSRSGWSRGLIPQIDVQVSNDMVNTTEIFYRIVHMIGEKTGVYRFPAGAGEGHYVPLARASASVRGYAMLSRARSAIYPRWGIGAEAGLSLRPGATDLFSPSAFAYLYGYVPGLMDTHGIRLTAMHQTRMDGRMPDSYVTSLPRGFSSVSGLASFIMARYGQQTRMTFDYAMPLLPLDWSVLGPVAYVRNLELTLHVDADIMSGPYDRFDPASRLLYSAGADLAVRLGNFLWIPYATRIGLSYNYCGHNVPEKDLAVADMSLPTHDISFVFTVDLP